MRRIEMSAGMRFGRLELLHERKPQKNQNSAGSRRYWLCRCDCGREVTVEQSNLRGGLSTSCGCQRRETCSKRLLQHGKGKSPEHQAWRNAKGRCFNPRNESYADYGGRGITMDPLFVNSFEAFYAEVGPRPGPDYSLDRKDVNGNYAPSNLRWATVEEQLVNRRNPHLWKKK